MRLNLSLAILCAVIGCAIHAPAFALSNDKPRGVTWSLVDAEIEGKPGETVIVRVKGEIPKDWHTYTVKKYAAGEGPGGTALQIEPKDQAAIVESGITYDPKPYIDAFSTKAFGNTIEACKGTLTLGIPVKIGAFAGDSLKLSLKITSMICTEGENGVCMNPTTAELAPVIVLKKKVSNADHIYSSDPAQAGLEIEWNQAQDQQSITASPGDVIKLYVKAMIQNGWHTFPTKQSQPKGLTPKQLDAWSYIAKTGFKIIVPTVGKDGKTVPMAVIIAADIKTDRAPKVILDEEGVPSEVFEDAVVFEIPVQISLVADSSGTESLTLAIDSQACQSVCKQIKAKLNYSLKLVPRSALVIMSSAAPAAPTAGNTSSSSGLLAFLWAAAVAGAISLVTPCVFPMIPITVSFFTKRKHISHGRAIRDALIFSAGIVFTYVGLAFVLELAFGKNIRDLATNPWMNLAIFGIFVALALSLFGFYELQLPTGWINKLNKSAHEGNSTAGLLLMGLVFTMTSFSCTGPFVGTVMLVAVKGDWLWPLLGMTVFASVFALPFFLLALFPTALKSLPKSGGWLNSVKVVMGFVEVAAALKFLSNTDLTWNWHVVTFDVFYGIWALIALATGLYLLGVFRFPHDTPLKKRSIQRIVFAALFVIAAGYCGSAIFNERVQLGWFGAWGPPREYPTRKTDNWESGIAQGRKAGKPIFFDFTGITCTNCRRMEQSMFTRDEIKALMKKFVVIQLYTDVPSTPEEVAASEKNSKTQAERFGNVTLPFYVIVTPDDKVLAQFDKGYTENVEEFKSFLNKGRLVSSVKESPNWQARLAAAQKENKRLFFNFENVCDSNFLKNEDENFKRLGISELLKNCVQLKIENCSTQSSSDVQFIAEDVRTSVHPFYAVIASDGNVLADIDKDEFGKGQTSTNSFAKFKESLQTVSVQMPTAQN
ncbi:MAG TPA: cytochrome c biogenesis protein CcdA [Planctomycetota bacterium]|nr:cytochrome c biogenesis protein CcdA [Planctomycetota bacterium]